jgi:hypothetical protein
VARGCDISASHKSGLRRNNQKAGDALSDCETDGNSTPLLSAEYELLRKYLLGDDEGADVVDKAPHRCALRGLTKMLAVVRGGADTLPYLIRVVLGQGNGKPFLVNRCGILLPQVRASSAGQSGTLWNVHPSPRTPFQV